MKVLILVILMAAAGVAAFVFASRASGKRTSRAVGDIYAFRARTIEGEDVPLSRYRGRTLLVVNTASRCGNTPQYESLEKLYERYRSQGFEVLAFPANNFGNQEPGTNAEIKEFCSVKYGTSFPMFEKVSVKGADIVPLFAWLTRDSGYPGDIDWNFAKFLVGKDGRVVARFPARMDPLSKAVTTRIDETLAAR